MQRQEYDNKLLFLQSNDYITTGQAILVSKNDLANLLTLIQK